MNGVPLDDALVTETVEELQFAINEENAGGKATWVECFSSRNAMWKRTGNGMMLQFIQQLNGQNFYCEPTAFSTRALLIRESDYYGDTFFKSAGTKWVQFHVFPSTLLMSDRLSPYVIQTILGAVSVAGTIPALVRNSYPS